MGGAWDFAADRLRSALKTSPHNSSFAFAVCQLGAEPALKAEILRRYPGWRFAFSRPGFVTWRTDTTVADDLNLGAVFARAFGISLGRAADSAAVIALAQRLRECEHSALVLHVFPRNHSGACEEAGLKTPRGLEDEANDAWAAAVRDQLLQAAPADLFVAEAKQPRVGELVLDVIVAQGEPMAVGAHRHHSGHLPYPGGRIPLTRPPEAPSRAWLKIEEALGWSALPLRAGETAVEIGSAPGGASWALLQRGLTVIGVDPGAMDPRVLAQPRFSHLQTTLGDVRREQLPARVDWLLLDVNLAPQVALHGIRRIVSTLRGTLRGVVFTLKLNDWDMAAELPALCERIQGMGLHSLKVRQLVANRREVCVVAYAQPQAKSLPGLSHSHSQP